MGNTHVRTIVSISLILFSLLLLSCSGGKNETIVKDVKKKIAADPVTHDSSVEVKASSGTIVLTGQVKTSAAQLKVEQFAGQEPGISDVEDHMLVLQAENVSSSPGTVKDRSGLHGSALEPPPTSQVMLVGETPPAEVPETPEPPQRVVIPSGTVLTVRLNSALGSSTSKAGQNFEGVLQNGVSRNGKTIIPRGSTVSGTVVEAKAKGKLKGEAVLNLRLNTITVRKQVYTIQTHVLQNTAKGKGKRTAATTGGGAAGGALIGGIAGGGKGAGIGALVGGAAGLVGGAATGNQQIEIPAESALSFRLSSPLTVQ